MSEGATDGPAQVQADEPGRRFRSVSAFDEVTKTEPEKSLLEPVKRKGGRNNQGRITTRHQGGGHKRRYRVIDFKRRKDGVPAKVAAIEYDPNRSARIALLHYADGAKAYILAPAGLRVGARSSPAPRPTSSPATRSAPNIPTGTLVHNVELKPGRGGRMARSAAPASSSSPRTTATACCACLRRDAPRAAHLPRHGRPGREHRPREHLERQGGPQPLARQAPDRARLRHEPRRPPARRRRASRRAAAIRSRPGACRRSASARAASTRNPTSSSSAAAAAGRRGARCPGRPRRGPSSRRAS